MKLRIVENLYPQLWVWQFLSTYFWDISSDKISGDNNECDTLTLCIEIYPSIEYLHRSVNTQMHHVIKPCMGHKDPFKVQKGPTNFNVTE